MERFRPLSDRILVRREEPKQMTGGGIVIPDAAKEKPVRGEVLAVGKGRPLENGGLLVPDVKVGDVVIFGKYSGTEVEPERVSTDSREKLVLLREDDLLAVVEG